MKNAVILGGGTVFHIRPHLALSAPAYGATARQLEGLCIEAGFKTTRLLTRMADSSSPLETNKDVSNCIDQLLENQNTNIIFFTVAMCDFDATILTNNGYVHTGKNELRLKSNSNHNLMLANSEKIINKIRKTRKDIFLVGCKTTTSAYPDEMFEAGLRLLKNASCNLVLVNDLHTKLNMIVTPEQARYAVTTDRDFVLRELVDMTRERSNLHFTRSKVVDGKLIEWQSESIPTNLRTVVDYCVSKGAYKPFMGKTVGHFAIKVTGTKFITSIRKTNFNDLNNVGMVQVVSTGPDEITAYGAKPSVGGMSQRIIFRKFPDLDCIVHFHCQKKPDSKVPIRSQREFECGSHECGQNTADGLESFDGIHAVMLDKHGPNIVFNRNVDPNKVIQFIEQNFDLSKQTSELM